jgi:predicted ATPase
LTGAAAGRTLARAVPARGAVFERRVREALGRLHDLPYLQTHPLAARAGGGKALRRDLSETLDALGSGRRDGRAHRLLVLAYAEALPAREVWRRLGLSKSAYYREHGRAVAAVAALLEERWAGAAARGAAPPGGPSAPPLPIPPTSFVGREAALAEVTDLLGTTRLLTLTGAGGCGKTRLALEAAAGAAERYAHGVRWVDLAPLAEPALVPDAVAAALGAREAPGRSAREALLDALRDKTLLLALDNCEHLVEAAASLAEAALLAGPGVRVLATSREPLRAAGEVTWPVPPLAVPPEPDGDGPLSARLAGYAAARLFADRAAAAAPGFALTDANAAAVARVCRRLDGIPLALEMAAARVRALPVEQIAARLDDAFDPEPARPPDARPAGGGRFDLLDAGGRTAPPRQRTLRATLDWSHGLLADDERTLFRRLGVFAGGFALEAAEAVGGGGDLAPTAVVGLLAGLVEKSLVVAESRGGAARYRLLETVRAYARERLAGAAEAAAAAERHARFYVALGEHAGPALFAPAYDAWLDRLEDALADLRAALAWCLRHDPAAGLRLVGALWRFWRLRAHYAEGRRWAEELLARAPADAPARGAALLVAGTLAHDLGDASAARARLGESLPLLRAAGDRRGAADALMGLGQLAEGDPARARALLEESLALYRAIGDTSGGIGNRLYYLGQLALAAGDHTAARRLFGESLASARAGTHAGNVGGALAHLGILATAEGDYGRARALLEEALAVARPVAHRAAVGWFLGLLGRLAWFEGAPQRADALLRENLERNREAGARGGVAWALRQLGSLARAAGEPAGPLLEESLALSRASGARAGAGWTLGQLAALASEAGDPGRAAELARESLGLFRALGLRTGAAYGLRLAATSALRAGAPARAVRLHGAAAAAYPHVPPDLGPAEPALWEADLRTARAALGGAAFAAAWAAGAATPLDRAVAEALGGRPV